MKIVGMSTIAMNHGFDKDSRNAVQAAVIRTRLSR